MALTCHAVKDGKPGCRGILDFASAGSQIGEAAALEGVPPTPCDISLIRPLRRQKILDRRGVCAAVRGSIYR
jgi:hypothetical protein